MKKVVAANEDFPQAEWSPVVPSDLATGSVPAWFLRARNWVALVALLGYSTAVAWRPRVTAIASAQS